MRTTCAYQSLNSVGSALFSLQYQTNSAMTLWARLMVSRSGDQKFDHPR